MPLYPEDLNLTIDLSNVPIFVVDKVSLSKHPYVITFKDAIIYMDELNKTIDRATTARTVLTKEINEFLNRP
jgi:hypothetical protein